MDKVQNSIMKTDDLLELYAEKGAKLTVRLLDDEDVLIEGTSEALEFLGKLILAHLEENEDGKHISPFAAGSAFFSSESTKGIYIHRLPCEHEGHKESVASK
jgi:hypothetical protein